jgi:cold shock CspA family protein
MMATGSVKWFSDDGAKVEYEEEQGPKGPNAVNGRTI